MKLFASAVFAAVYTAVAAVGLHDHDKVVCFWNSISFKRRGDAKFQVYDLQPALAYCTHLVYGFAGINTETLEVVPLHPDIDIRGGLDSYRAVLQMRRTYPDLKVCLSIGGNADPYEETHKYLVMTRSTEVRAKFVDSVDRLLTEYDFDCIDLAWQFPKAVGYHNFKDEHEAEHRDGFTTLVRDLKNLLEQRINKELTITVLPRVNATAYYDVRSLVPNIDAVHIFAFDQKTPERNPKEADYPAPIYGNLARPQEENIDAQVKYWLKHGTPGSKVVVGIPTFAWTWRLRARRWSTRVPPVNVDGPGITSPNTETPGLLSYTEVCDLLMKSAVGRTVLVGSSSKYGSYAFLSSVGNDADDVWVGFEEPRTARNKAAYARLKNLGGVAIYDLSLDDFKGICTEDKFPILKAAKEMLSI